MCTDCKSARSSCHSNETHALTANPPNNAQLGGTSYPSPKLHSGPRAVVRECGEGQTDRQADRWPCPPYISRRPRLTRNVMTVDLLQLYAHNTAFSNYILHNTEKALLHFAWVVDDAKCIVAARVSVSVCLSVCPRPHAYTIARTHQM